MLPAVARRPAAVVAACCAAITLTLAILVARTTGPGPLDRSADSVLVTRLGPHVRAVTWFMDLGEPVQVTLATVVLAVAFVAWRRVSLAVLAAISVPAAAILTEAVLKPVVGRTLGTSLSYPSGHTCSAFALATVIIVALVGAGRTTTWPPRVLRLAVMTGCLGLAAAVGVAMVSLGYHYLTDVVGGAALGITVTLSATFLLDRPGNASRLARAGARLSRRSRPGS
jgi:membrane-associated phospholipid phosphatase